MPNHPGSFIQGPTPASFVASKGGARRAPFAPDSKKNELASIKRLSDCIWKESCKLISTNMYYNNDQSTTY